MCRRGKERCRRPSLIERQHHSCYTLWIKSNAFRRCLQCLKPYKLLLMKTLSVLIQLQFNNIYQKKVFLAQLKLRLSRCLRVIIFCTIYFPLVCPGGWGILLRRMSQVWGIWKLFVILARGKDIWPTENSIYIFQCMWGCPRGCSGVVAQGLPGWMPGGMLADVDMSNWLIHF